MQWHSLKHPSPFAAKFVPEQPRMLRYHGLSEQSSSYRQSATYGNANQIGIPSAPARWGTSIQVFAGFQFLFSM
jgi:hypothetical protein